MMQNERNPIEIPYSRTKLAALCVISVLFVSLGLWFSLKPQDVTSSAFQSPALIRIAGLVVMLVFGACGIFILKKLSDKKPGVIISNEGITDQSNASSVGFIPWGDVVSIKELDVFNQKFVGITVKNPEHYISLQTSFRKKKLLQANYKMYGTIANITANALQCHHHQLKALVEDMYARYKTSTSY